MLLQHQARICSAWLHKLGPTLGASKRELSLNQALYISTTDRNGQPPQAAGRNQAPCTQGNKNRVNSCPTPAHRGEPSLAPCTCSPNEDYAIADPPPCEGGSYRRNTRQGSAAPGFTKLGPTLGASKRELSPNQGMYLTGHNMQGQVWCKGDPSRPRRTSRLSPYRTIHPTRTVLRGLRRLQQFRGP